MTICVKPLGPFSEADSELRDTIKESLTIDVLRHLCFSILSEHLRKHLYAYQKRNDKGYLSAVIIQPPVMTVTN